MTGLSLYDCKIKNLNRIISPLKKLTNLTELDLSSNQLSDISPLKELTNLTDLFLRKNPIEELPSWIVDFKGDLHWESFTIKFIGDDDAYGVTFYDNPLKTPPVEIVKQGKEAVRNYFEQLKKQGKDNIYEAKLMLVGEPGSGKTTLMNLLFDKNFPVPNKKQKSTLGIEVRQNWGFSIDDKKDFKAHIWDFGGQQIQYMLHQFFLTSDCLYVLMAEKRRELANFDYWLNIINILGKNSPVVTLFNEINIDTIASFIYDEKKYKNLFPELSLQRLDVNLAAIGDGRFEALLHTIKKQLSRLELVGKEVPARWVDIRKELEKRRTKKHIHINEYFEICRKFEIEQEADQMLILRYFHLLGIVLHFCEDENLCDTLFLDPNWTVDAIYSVLANKEIEKSNGFIKKSDIDKIWSDKGYEFDERAKLLQLMLKDKFELCYEYDKRKNHYIIPDLLPKELKNEPELNQGTLLRFVMTYDYLPAPIISRLMLRLKNDIVDGQQWKYGMILDNKEFGCQAKIKADESNKRIDITVQGEFLCKRQYFSAIRHNIYDINKDFENLEVQEFIPLPGFPDLLVEYKELLGYERAGRDEYFVGKLGKSFSVSEMLDSVISKAERAKQYQSFPACDFDEKMERRFDELKDKLDNTTQSILNKIEKENRSAVSIILSKLDESEKRVVDLIFEKIKENKISEMEIYEVLLGVKQGIEQIKAKKIEGNDADQIKRIDVALNETKELSSKFKLTIPIIPLFFNFEQEIDVSKSLHKFWEKWKNVLI